MENDLVMCFGNCRHQDYFLVLFGHPSHIIIWLRTADMSTWSKHERCISLMVWKMQKYDPSEWPHSIARPAIDE